MAEGKFIYSQGGSCEETKAWLRKLISRKIITEENPNTYKGIIDELGSKLNAFITTTRAK